MTDPSDDEFDDPEHVYGIVETSWRTAQFFLDSMTGAIDEVEWRQADGHMRCTCGYTGGICPHMAVVRSRAVRLDSGVVIVPIPFEPEAADEIVDNDLDLSDPDVWRDLVRRFGRPVVL